jgi:ribosome-associated protein
VSGGGEALGQSGDLTLETALACARMAEEQKAHDIDLFDVSAILVVTQYFLICTCDSGPQLRAVVSDLDVTCKKAGLKKLGAEVDIDATWGLLDYGDLVCHVFRGDARAYYALEDLWADAPRVEWTPAGGAGEAS